jgi:cyanophycinase
MGGGYDEVLPGVAQLLHEQVGSAEIKVTVVPASYSTNPYAISASERARNLQDAERRRAAIESRLQATAPAGAQFCVALAPVCVRGDAEAKINLRYFGRDVAAVFLLGGDQAVAMCVLRGTPVEGALQDLYGRGGVIAGTSAGAGMQSRAMLAGYSAAHNMHNSLHAGAAAVWNRRESRGLAFGARGAIFDQHFFQRGRMGRLLEAILRPGAPAVGVGIDAYTGLRVQGSGLLDKGQLDSVFGLYSVAVLDAKSYGAAAAASYGGPHATLSVRNVLVHLLAPGPYNYDLQARQHSLAPRPPMAARRFTGPALPQTAGPLFLCGGLRSEGHRAADGTWQKFLALGAQREGAAVIPKAEGDVDPAQLTAACDAWRGGAPLWLEGAAAAMAGAYYCAGRAAQTSCDPEDLPAQEAAEIAAKRALLQGYVRLETGLGLLGVNIEPHMVEDGGWNRLFTLAYEHRDREALAVGANTTLLVSHNGAEVLGEESVVALDLRRATLDLGLNGAFVVANGLLDVYAPGEQLPT